MWLASSERLFYPFMLMATVLSLSIVKFNIISLRTTILLDDGLTGTLRKEKGRVEGRGRRGVKVLNTTKLCIA